MQSLHDRITEANFLLAPFAIPHGRGLGRVYPEEEDETRFPFQRDRDRIIHTQAFRRLRGKTQVFIALVEDPADRPTAKVDHYRTRLTHTMEVAQISRDMARTLQLNEDLAECIALAHDLGHPPFGHAGEAALNEELERHGRHFEHNLQSLRIVTLLEHHSAFFPGLNLNREVLEGLRKYPSDSLGAAPRLSLEAQLVNLADEVAYTAHDVDDGLRAGILRVKELLHLPLFAEALERAAQRQTEVRGALIHLLVMDAYRATEENLQALHIISSLVSFSPSMREKLAELHTYLWEHLYSDPLVLRPSERGKETIRSLFRTYEAQPPEKVLTLQRLTGGPLVEAIKDYIAGMTDTFAVAMAREKSHRQYAGLREA
jgi:dGTPase